MNRSVLRASIAATAFALAASLTGCGASGGSDADRETSSDPAWQSILDAAYEEGELNLYNAASEVQNERMLEAWSERYPQIELKITRGGPELPARVAAEIESKTGGADVFMFSDTAWFERNKAELADISNVPSVEGWKENYWAVDGQAVVATTLPWSMVVWNTKIFPDGFKTYEDLLAPEVKGQLGSRSEVTPSIAGYLEFLEAELGDDYLEALADQKPKFYGSAIPLMQAVASGEVGVSNIGVPAAVLDLQESGAPIDYALMRPGFAFEHGGAALKNSAHPNAAVLFMNWFMSEEGQTAYNGEGQGGAGREGIDGALNLDDHALLDSAKYTPEELAKWKAKFHGWFG
jgi:iron(III) transport system substrate-binding protein